MRRVGKQTIVFQDPPLILNHASVVGPKEGEGPLQKTFDLILDDTLFGEKSWEKAECKILQAAVNLALDKENLGRDEIDFLLAGDLLNQNISANYAARQLAIPFFGLYGACSTMAESLILGAVLVDGEFAEKVVAAVSSHHDTAERQYRFPTEQGVQRPLTAQWTVTGAGAALIGKGEKGTRITHATVGKVIDLGIKDQSDMGAAMAPAATDTLIRHFTDTGRKPADYDLIITGDLATIGKELTHQLMEQQGYPLGENFADCGLLIYDPTQDTHAGGSGCACSAVVTCGHLLHSMSAGMYQKIMLVGTGALLSPISMLQGESIPGIAHAVVIENY
ncbi:stage V sporulation protein AD [Dehalobacterium formicoaceticum]|uniref:Stage V sporulation protein AD n=1 Tax=Dehalobacterium formicoaceticum TaxID=51515 RepID=A0ABT1Y4M9_9FIRM|nr:stage V sporulation protein AD [Dehalobacterium formicoaceticum]MCR6545833.1 stage V sporulation protein AD [Dehalobacterium formicoaceticum]